MKDELGIKMEVEVVRESPTAFRAFSVHLFDYLLFFLTSFGLLFGIHPLLSNAPQSRQAWADRERIQEESGLYVKEEKNLVNLGAKMGSSSLPYTLQIETMAPAIINYFENYFSTSEWDKSSATYHELLAKAMTKDGNKMFNFDKTRKLNNPDYDKEYAEFYIELAKNTAPGYLNYKKGYAESRSTIIRFLIYALELSFLIAYLFYFLLFPLLFHKGKQTLGMKLSKIYTVDAKALSPALGKYLIYRLFHFTFFIVIAPFALMIPFFISATMLWVRKPRQTLFEYVFAYFPIQAEKDEVFESEEEAAKGV